MGEMSDGRSNIEDNEREDVWWIEAGWAYRRLQNKYEPWKISDQGKNDIMQFKICDSLFKAIKNLVKL